MRAYRQIVKHRPEEGLYGDCWRTAIGCLLDLPPEEVPHFNNGVTPEECTRHTDDWLELRGLAMAHIPFTVPEELGIEGVLTTMGNVNERLCYLLSGHSSADEPHVIVCRGGRVFCDPAFGEARHSLVGPMKTDGFWWVNFLVPTHQQWVPEPLRIEPNEKETPR